jgi:hypothetical protein
MSTRTGFLARGGSIGVGILSVTHGYGPLSDTPLIFEGAPKAKEGGIGPLTAIARQPKPTILSLHREVVRRKRVPK